MISAVALPALFLIPGCGIALQANFFKADMNRISVEPTDAKILTIEADECYWWVENDGILHVAARGRTKSLLGPHLDRDFDLSFVLGPASRGSGKDFSATSETARGMIRTASGIYRMRSAYGIVGIEHRPGNRIVGAYRMFVGLQGVKYLGGWTQPNSFVLFGNFTAEENADRGREILRATEEDGFERTSRSGPPDRFSRSRPAPATRTIQPSTRPAPAAPGEDSPADL